MKCHGDSSFIVLKMDDGGGRVNRKRLKPCGMKNGFYNSQMKNSCRV